VKKLREATSEALKKRALAALKTVRAHGTTTLEAKSGYGLDVASELKILRLHKELAAEHATGNCVHVSWRSHSVPEEYRGKAAGTERYIKPSRKTCCRNIGESRLAEFCECFAIAARLPSSSRNACCRRGGNGD